jgi:hypothetical protein
MARGFAPRFLFRSLASELGRYAAALEISVNRVLPSVITLVVAAASAGCRRDAPLPAVRIETPVAPPHTSVGCTGSRYDGTGLGELRIGATVASIRSVCSVVRDTTELREEGMPTHVLAVAFGIDTVEAEIDSGRVWRIALGSSRFRTTDSLGVGVPIGRFLSMRGIHGITGEGALYLVSPTHCGLSFRVTDPILDAPPEDWTVAMLKRLPATSIVTEVLIVGCQAAA